MSRSFEIDDDTAEGLLSGRVGADDAPPGYSDVAALLAAASAPATATELLNEADAVAMFRSESTGASVAPVVDLESRRSNRRTFSRAAMVGIAAGIILGGTGVAAAATGKLPDPVQTVAHDTLSHIGVSVPAPPPKAPRPPAEPTTAKDPKAPKVQSDPKQPKEPKAPRETTPPVGPTDTRPPSPSTTRPADPPDPRPTPTDPSTPVPPGPAPSVPPDPMSSPRSNPELTTP